MYHGNQRCWLVGYVTYQYYYYYLLSFFDVYQTGHGIEVLNHLYQRFFLLLHNSLFHRSKKEKTSGIQGIPGVNGLRCKTWNFTVNNKYCDTWELEIIAAFFKPGLLFKLTVQLLNPSLPESLQILFWLTPNFKWVKLLLNCDDLQISCISIFTVHATIWTFHAFCIIRSSWPWSV